MPNPFEEYMFQLKHFKPSLKPQFSLDPPLSTVKSLWEKILVGFHEDSQFIGIIAHDIQLHPHSEFDVLGYIKLTHLPIANNCQPMCLFQTLALNPAKVARFPPVCGL